MHRRIKLMQTDGMGAVLSVKVLVPFALQQVTVPHTIESNAWPDSSRSVCFAEKLEGSNLRAFLFSSLCAARAWQTKVPLLGILPLNCSFFSLEIKQKNQQNKYKEPVDC